MRYITFITVLLVFLSCANKKTTSDISIGEVSKERISVLEIERNPKQILNDKALLSDNASTYLTQALCWTQLQETDSAYQYLQKSWSFSYQEEDSLVSELVQAYILFRRKNIQNAIAYLKDQPIAHRSNSNKIYHYRALSQYHALVGDLFSAIESVNNGLNLLKQEKDFYQSTLYIDMELNLVEGLIEKGEIVKAISILDQLKNKSNLLSNVYYSIKADLLLANIHAYMDNDNNAFEYLFPALASAKKIESCSLLIDIYSAIASVFIREENPEKALKYLNDGLAVIDKCETQNSGGNLYLQYGHVYLDKGESNEALIYFKKALDHFHKNNNALKKAWSHYSIGKVYLKEKAVHEAKKHFNLADDIRSASELANTTSFIDLEINTIFCYAQLNQLEDNDIAARVLFEKAYRLAKENKQDRLQILVLRELSFSSEKRGEAQLALDYFRKLELMKRKVRHKQKTYMVAAAEFEYQALQNRQKIDMQDATLNVQRAEIKKVTTLLGVVGVISIICIVTLIIANNLRRKRGEALSKLEEQNKALESKTEELQRINGFKDQLISVVGHDLRSPIGMLKTSLDFLVESADELPKEDILRFMISFQPNVTQTYNMINNLLVWAQSQQGRLTIDKQEITLGKLMADEIAILTEQSSRKNINLNVSWDSAISVFCDQPTISTALRNIISNALKFTPEGGEVKLVAKSEGAYKCIEITDSGIGMDDKLINKILNGEKIVSEKGTNNERGTGLGLVICKEFIVKNDGEMKIKSKKGEGTTISVYVPSVN